MDAEQKIPQSQMNEAFTMAAVDACALLRQWSDSDGRIGPGRIGEFQAALTEQFAAMYYGTHKRLERD